MAGLDCGVDIGSTNIKVALSDEAGRAVFSRTAPTPRVSGKPDVATNALALVALLESMIVEGWRRVRASEPLRSVVVAGVGEDGIGITRELAPTGLALPWFDSRAAKEAEELRAGPAETPRAGIAVASDRTAAKWLWLRRNRPDELKGARHWIALTDFPAVRWTGRPFMSSTLAPRTACFDVYGRAWIGPLLEASRAPPLPPLLGAGEIAGTMSAGPLIDTGAASTRTVVVVGGHDHPIAASAIRRLDPTARVDSMGTANLVYGEAAGPKTPYFDPFMAFSIPPLSQNGVACLGVMELSDALAPLRSNERLFRSILAADRIPGRPNEHPSSGAAISCEVEAIRRALEATSFHARRMFAAMDEAGAPPGRIYATGGWARSTALLELRASIFGAPIHLIDEPELTAIGAAYLGAAAACGASPSLQATRQVTVVDPVYDWVSAYEMVFPDIRRRLDDTAQRPEPNQA